MYEITLELNLSLLIFNMESFKHTAKKSLGQNFLNSNTYKRLIVETSQIKAGDIILEVGPGKGALSELILTKVEQLGGLYIAVEKDDKLFEYLSEKFATQIEKGIFVLIHGDILDEHIQNEIYKKIGNKAYKIIANIPYYITGEIIRLFLTTKQQPESMTLLVQKEVAERINARSRGKEIGESILSLSVKVFGNVKYIETVKAKNFSPQPKVDSAIIFMNNISRKFFGDDQTLYAEKEKAFFEIVKAGFAHKRKKLFSNLVEKGYEKEAVRNIFQNENISLDIRAEKLALNDWKKLLVLGSK